MPLQQFDERQLFTNKAAWPVGGTPGVYFFMFGEVSYDLRIDSIQLFNSDSVDHNYVINDEGELDKDALGAILVPAGAGYGGVASVDALALIQPAAYHYLLVPTGTALKFTIREALASGGFVTAYSQGGFV